MSDEIFDLNYTAVPTARMFHNSTAFVRGIMGPVGSGKSVACCWEIAIRSMQQKPNSHGVRKTRWAIIRNTYPELKVTTIKTWQEWFPHHISPFNWGSPITSWLKIPLADGTNVDAEIIFLALDRPQDVKKLLSLELTGFWINEARELPKAILDAATGRVGRYPAKRDGGPTWTGGFLDTNPPDDDHWWYALSEVKQPNGWKFFRQPPALIREGDDYMPNPDAENIENHSLGYNYYLNMVGGKSLDWINVYVMGNYGTVMDGRPVYPEWNDNKHVSKEPLEPMRGLPIRLGWDFGLTPACAFFQISPKGQLVILDECVSQEMGIRTFVNEVVKPKLANDYDNMKVISYGDPAGTQRSQTEEDTCMQILAEEGIPTDPASSQEYIKRRESVARYLTMMIDDEPGLILDPKCRYLRKGFNGAYKYDRIQVPGEERFKDRPSKTLASHVHEGLQYGALEVQYHQNITRPVALPTRKRSSLGWT